MPGFLGGHDQEGVVGRGVAVNGHAVKRRIGQFTHQLWQQARCDLRVRRQKTEHGCHVRTDHARALADAGDGDQRTTNHHLGTEGFGNGVGGHDAFGGTDPVALGRILDGCRQARFDALDRQRLHDHTGGKRQHLLRCQIQQTCRGHTGGAGAHQAIVPRARIRVTGVDHNGTHVLATGQMFTTDLHRSSAKTVLREHPGHRGAFVQQKHGQVLATDLADARLGHTNTHTRYSMDVSSLRGREMNRHGQLSKISGNYPENKWQKSRNGPQPVSSFRSAEWHGQARLPWQLLNFLPLPHGQGSLRPIRMPANALAPAAVAAAPATAPIWPGRVSASPVSVGAV